MSEADYDFLDESDEYQKSEAIKRLKSFVEKRAKMEGKIANICHAYLEYKSSQAICPLIISRRAADFVAKFEDKKYFLSPTSSTDSLKKLIENVEELASQEPVVIFLKQRLETLKEEDANLSSFYQLQQKIGKATEAYNQKRQEYIYEIMLSLMKAKCPRIACEFYSSLDDELHKSKLFDLLFNAVKLNQYISVSYLVCFVEPTLEQKTILVQEIKKQINSINVNIVKELDISDSILYQGLLDKANIQGRNAVIKELMPEYINGLKRNPMLVDEAISLCQKYELDLADDLRGCTRSNNIIHVIILLAFVGITVYNNFNSF